MPIVVMMFLFFQAEDGIRDLTVTGVQTCALPISVLLDALRKGRHRLGVAESCTGGMIGERITNIPGASDTFIGDRKSTRLNSSHSQISYAVFCLKKKKKNRKKHVRLHEVDRMSHK